MFAFQLCMGLPNKFEIRTYRLGARVIYQGIYTLFLLPQLQNRQYSITFSIEYIVLILHIERQYSIFNNR
jgi:hypothetical protein